MGRELRPQAQLCHPHARLSQSQCLILVLAGVQPDQGLVGVKVDLSFCRGRSLGHDDPELGLVLLYFLEEFSGVVPRTPLAS